MSDVQNPIDIETPIVIATFGVANSLNAVQVSNLCSDCLREGLKRSSSLQKDVNALTQVIENTWGAKFAVTVVNGQSVCVRHASVRLAFELNVLGIPKNIIS